MCMWRGRGSGKVKQVKTGGGFLDRQGVQKENRKGISGHGWTGAGRKHAGEGEEEQAPSLTARNRLHFLAFHPLCSASFLFQSCRVPSLLANVFSHSNLAQGLRGVSSAS